jgi:AcrR family transcriptional regulator
MEKPAKQARSRLTLHRLLSATEALLEHGGLEAATVPAIAEAAGVSVGVLYRRFPNKDALIRAVYERFFSIYGEQNRARLQTVTTLDRPLPATARSIVIGMTRGYRERRGLLRALTRYARTHPDAAFREAAKQMNRQTVTAIVYLLIRHRGQMTHPDPEKAIELGLLAVAATLQNILLEEETLHGVREPERLEEEMVRLFFGYLGIREETHATGVDAARP